jgi:nickel-type superoxide dismutase maturation protease
VVAAGAIVLGAMLLRGHLGWSSMRRLRRSWQARVAIEGRSMEPALEPGDWILVDPDAYRRTSPRPGELVIAPDPREPSRLLLKRVGSIGPGGALRLIGDAPERSTDSRTFGAVDPATIVGRPWFRYWPPQRMGRIDRAVTGRDR